MQATVFDARFKDRPFDHKEDVYGKMIGWLRQEVITNSATNTNAGVICKTKKFKVFTCRTAAINKFLSRVSCQLH